MNLYLHLLIHFSFSLLAGFIVWRIWKQPLASFAAGISGGFLIDSDHLIDYLSAFGINFNLFQFFSGAQFSNSGKIYVLFHGWEYIILFMSAALIIKQKMRLKSAFLALALGIFFHLSADMAINDGMRFRGYSILYRIKNNFAIEKLVTEEHYRRYLEKITDSGSIKEKNRNNRAEKNPQEKPEP